MLWQVPTNGRRLNSAIALLRAGATWAWRHALLGGALLGGLTNENKRSTKLVSSCRFDAKPVCRVAIRELSQSCCGILRCRI